MLSAVERRTFRIGNLHVIAPLNGVAIGKPLFCNPDDPVRIRERNRETSLDVYRGWLNSIWCSKVVPCPLDK
jgi:hypothetical protein